MENAVSRQRHVVHKSAALVFVLAFMACRTVTVDPCGDSLFFFANAGGNALRVMPITVFDEDSMPARWVDIAAADTGYLGRASAMGPPSPSYALQELDIRIIDTGGGANRADTINPVSDTDWHSEWLATDGACTRMKWVFSYPSDSN